MNKPAPSGVALERAVADVLRGLLGSVSWLKGWSVERHPSLSDRGFDLRAKIPLAGGKERELWIQCKSDPRPSQFRHDFPSVVVASARKRSPVLVLAAPHVSPNMARICEGKGWSWFDLAGNCHLDVPNALFVERKGNPPVHVPRRPSANLSTPEAGRVVRGLLAPENAGIRWTHQSLSNECQPGVSIGLVNKIAKHLRDERYVEYLPLPQEGFRLRDPVGLLTAWREAYRFDRHERHGYFTLLQGNRLNEALANLDSQTGGFAAYASFSAADFQAPHVRQPKTWLFVGARHLDSFEEIVHAKPVDTGENLVVLVPNDDGVFYLGDGGPIGERRMGCTNLVQTYMDLSHGGGRGEEAAEALLEQRLKPEWKRHQLL